MVETALGLSFGFCLGHAAFGDKGDKTRILAALVAMAVFAAVIEMCLVT